MVLLQSFLLIKILNNCPKNKRARNDQLILYSSASKFKGLGVYILTHLLINNIRHYLLKKVLSDMKIHLWLVGTEILGWALLGLKFSYQNWFHLRDMDIVTFVNGIQGIMKIECHSEKWLTFYLWLMLWSTSIVLLLLSFLNYLKLNLGITIIFLSELIHRKQIPQAHFSLSCCSLIVMLGLQVLQHAGVVLMYYMH